MASSESLSKAKDLERFGFAQPVLKESLEIV
jgi:hypothetical protein